ncbi:MAG: hypothetical protein N2323_04620 [candidate division WOR-3 bacterium]|nr:hypothetical protein [candidate division WOR-3 bacterium]MCX7837225.1 hypothetical protein [candidate division WOR-3 bacterium]MDW8114378.1 hypothetical protein [candidate division WOR-3 bacterium]
MIFILSLIIFNQTYLIDNPSPIFLGHGEYLIGFRLQGNNGIMANFGIGLFDRLNMGISYSGESILGSGKPTFPEKRGPEFQFRLKLVGEETFVFPDIILGFDSQGFGSYDTNKKGYSVPEKMFYLLLGKTIDITNTNFSGGVYYQDKVNFFISITQLLPNDFNVIFEYSSSFYEKERDIKNYGFLNAGIAWNFTEQVRFLFALREIIKNHNYNNCHLNRIAYITFQSGF